MIEVLAARAYWCAPDERIVWAHPIKSASGKAKYVLYQVSGLDEIGGKRWTAGKIIGGVASGVAGTALELMSPSEGDSYNAPTIPPVVVSGKRDCLAATHLSNWQASGANSRSGRHLVWMLTSHRLAFFDFAKIEEDGPGLLDGLKKRFGGPAKQDSDKADQRQPTPLPGFTVCAEFPRQILSNIDLALYKLKGREKQYLRIALADGSTIDLLQPDAGSYGAVDRMHALTHGRE